MPSNNANNRPWGARARRFHRRPQPHSHLISPPPAAWETLILPPDTSFRLHPQTKKWGNPSAADASVLAAMGAFQDLYLHLPPVPAVPYVRKLLAGRAREGADRQPQRVSEGGSETEVDPFHVRGVEGVDRRGLNEGLSHGKIFSARARGGRGILGCSILPKQGNGGQQYYLLPLQHPRLPSVLSLRLSLHVRTTISILLLLWILFLWRQWISSSPSLGVMRSRPVRAISSACLESSPATHSTCARRLVSRALSGFSGYAFS